MKRWEYCSDECRATRVSGGPGIRGVRRLTTAEIKAQTRELLTLDAEDAAYARGEAVPTRCPRCRKMVNQ